MTDDPDRRDDLGERVGTRAANLLPEEEQAGSDDPQAQAQALLEDSEARQSDRDAAPHAVVEHRSSDGTTPPLDQPK